MTKNVSLQIHSIYQEVLIVLQKDIDLYIHARELSAPETNLILARLRDSLRDFRLALESATEKENLIALCQDLYKDTPDLFKLRLLVASFLFDCCKAQFFWNELISLIKDYLKKPQSPSVAYNLFLNIEYLSFTNKAIFLEDSYLDAVRKPLKSLYSHIFEQYKQSNPITIKRGNAKRVAILLRLWRDPRLYTPALEALDYASVLTKNFGFEVKFFNINLLHDNMPLPFWPPGQFQPLPNTSNEIITYKDLSFQLWHRIGTSLDATSAAALWEELDNFTPSCAIAFGDCNIYADVLAESIPTATLHYTSDVPIRIKTIAGVQSELHNREQACKSLLESSCKRISLRPAASDIPSKKIYTRAEFGLPDNAFLFVIVGNRLRSEVTYKFLKRLDSICAACPKARFVFVGFYDHAEEHLKPFSKLQICTTYISHIEDVRAFMNIADVMLNPDRAGGGNSVSQALAAGKPVISSSHGDAALLIGDCTCNDDTDYTAKAIHLATNCAAYEQASKDALSRYYELIDRTVNMSATLATMNIK